VDSRLLLYMRGRQYPLNKEKHGRRGVGIWTAFDKFNTRSMESRTSAGGVWWQNV